MTKNKKDKMNIKRAEAGKGIFPIKHKQLSYFSIGLIGALIFIGLLTIVIHVNSLVASYIPAFTIVSATFLMGFAATDAILMAILLQYRYGKY